MSAYVHDTNFFTRRTAVLAAIIALHLFIFWALEAGLATRVVRLVAPPLKTTIVRQVRKHLPPPPPPPPQLVQQQVQVPPPMIQINVPAAAQSHAITVVKHVVRAAPPPPAPMHYTPLSPAGDFPSTQDYYPQASQRLGEQGTAIVEVCVGPNGRLSAEPKVIHSSGSPRLDRAALRYARATSGHWNPEKANGRPINFCGHLPIKFQLNDF
jgi:protein TonB